MTSAADKSEFVRFSDDNRRPDFECFEQAVPFWGTENFFPTERCHLKLGINQDDEMAKAATVAAFHKFPASQRTNDVTQRKLVEVIFLTSLYIFFGGNN